MKTVDISVDEAFALLKADTSTFVNVRDLGSWQSGHLPGAVHVGDHNVRAFIDVYSMSGGFAEWHGRPVEQSLHEPADPPLVRPRVDSAPGREPGPSRRKSWLQGIRKLSMLPGLRARRRSGR
jgi:hypothetical protein